MCKCKKGSYGDRVCKFILTFSGVFVIALQIDFVTYTSSLIINDFFNNNMGVSDANLTCVLSECLFKGY